VSQREFDLAAWRAAATYAELCELGARFLEGELCAFPGWMATDIDEETDALVPTLARANRGGFLTVASQPGHAEHEPRPGARYRNRAFVAGFASAAALRRIQTVPAPDLWLRVNEPANAEAQDTGRTDVAASGDAIVGEFNGAAHLALGPRAGSDELALFAEHLGPAGLDALAPCAFVTWIDPAWEARPRLWEALERAFGGETH